MIKRSGFKRPVYERPLLPPPRPIRKVAATQVSDEVIAAPKQAVVRSEAYRRLVAALPCKVCGAHGYSQAAHPNTGKGAGIKTDDRLCFPLCCDRPGTRGCHSAFDQGGFVSKQVRRDLEIMWSEQTRVAIAAAGAWPNGLGV